MLGAFEPRVGRLALAARRAVLTAAPAATEIIYDAYNAVATAYSYSGRLKEGFLHVAAYAHHVNLGFNQGASLADPAHLLCGTGTAIRHVRLAQPADLERPELRALIERAVAHAGPAPAGSRGRSIVRPTSGRKRRPTGGKRRG